jgi:hypothetical protein
MSDSEGRGYVMFRKYEDNVFVLMGSYTDKMHRGKGIFKTQFERLLKEEVKSGDEVYIALANKKILPYLLGIGFERIKEPVRYWGSSCNCVNLKMIKV